MFLSSLIVLGFKMNFNYYYFFSLIIPFIHLIYFQSYKLETKSSKDCLNKFKSNNFLGLIILFILLIGKIL